MNKIRTILCVQFRFRMIKSVTLQFSLLTSLAALSGSSQAQQLGHYIGGFTSLENGSSAPPGFYAAAFGMLEPISRWEHLTPTFRRSSYLQARCLKILQIRLFAFHTDRLSIGLQNTAFRMPLL